MDGAGRGGRSMGGIPPEIIKQMLQQQEDMKQRQRQLVINMVLLVLGYLFFQYGLPWIWRQYYLYREKQRRMDELIEKNKRLEMLLLQQARKKKNDDDNDDDDGGDEGEGPKSEPTPEPRRRPKPLPPPRKEAAPEDVEGLRRRNNASQPEAGAETASPKTGAKSTSQEQDRQPALSD